MAKEEQERRNAENKQYYDKIKVELTACKDKFKEGPRVFLEHLKKEFIKDPEIQVNDETCKEGN